MSDPLFVPAGLAKHWENEARHAWVENARLKAEVERLTSEVSYDNRVQLHVDKLAGEFTQAEVERLQAEVERLRKAGDAMASSIQFNEEMAKDYNGPTIVHQCVKRWNAAKEGKPSA